MGSLNDLVYRPFKDLSRLASSLGAGKDLTKAIAAGPIGVDSYSVGLLADAIGGDVGDKLKAESIKNTDNPERAVGRAAATAALLYGGYSAYGAYGGAGGAGGATVSGSAKVGAEVLGASAAESAAASAGTQSAASSFGSAAAKTAGQALATTAIAKAMSPKPPEVKGPIPMPDPLAQEAARQKKIAEATQRRGRASTILTQPSAYGLGS